MLLIILVLNFLELAPAFNASPPEWNSTVPNLKLLKTSPPFHTYKVDDAEMIPLSITLYEMVFDIIGKH